MSNMEDEFELFCKQKGYFDITYEILKNIRPISTEAADKFCERCEYVNGADAYEMEDESPSLSQFDFANAQPCLSFIIKSPKYSLTDQIGRAARMIFENFCKRLRKWRAIYKSNPVCANIIFNNMIPLLIGIIVPGVTPQLICAILSMLVYLFMNFMGDHRDDE